MSKFRSNIKITISELKIVFPYTLPVLTGFLLLGMTYGVLMHTKGYSFLYSTLMSILAFCGSMQFVAITLLTTAFDPLSAFLLSLMVNARHIFYGIAMLERYKGMKKIKPFLIFTLCDETFSILSSIQVPNQLSSKRFYAYVSLLDYSYWILGTFLGGLLANFVTIKLIGLDFVLTALFVVLFMQQMKLKTNRIYGIMGVIITSTSLMFFGRNDFIIMSMLLILISLLFMEKRSWY